MASGDKEGDMKTLMVFAAAGAMFAQTRGIVPEAVVQARPRPKTHAATAGARYQAVGDAVTASIRQPSTARQMGVTVWRLRAATPGDSGARILVQEGVQEGVQGSNTVEWVPERVGINTSLREGDHVRLTIESPDAGYLYVIDRERYSSGERGMPYLIFPTSRTRSGDNRVTGGKLVDIPAQDDRPNFFTLRHSRPDQSEEELTVILTPEPLKGLDIGAKALALTNEMVAVWEKQWGAGSVQRFELSGGAGKTWTKAEQEAAADRTRLLTQEDPAPQTVYRIAVKQSDPLLVKIRLRYASRAQ
jgi:hypothetical protein